MKKLLTGPLCLAVMLPALGAGSVQAQDFDVPPNAKPGQCWSRVLMPARYETVTEEVVLQPASERIELVPASYDWDEREIVIEEAYERLEIVPAKFSTRTETVTVEPAREEYRVIPARYETKTERVKVRDGYTTWKKGTGPITRLDATTGEILCLVEVPAEYRNVERQVLVSPARTEKVRVPAKTRTVERRVVTEPATTRKVRMPAKTQTVRYQKLVSPPRERKIPVAAVTDRVTFQKKVSEERLQWAEILCETNVTPGVVRNLQTALRDKGFYEGPIDGKLGAGTMAAVDAYQRRNRLSTGSLTIETMRKLGVATSTSA